MPPLLDFFLCCCGRNKSVRARENERQPLLGDDDGSPIYVPRDNLVNDRQKLKDRLSGIVRDKQGKMINISDHLPPNLIKQRGIPSTSTSRVRATSPSPHPSIGTIETESTSRSSSSAKVPGERLLLSKDLALNVRLIRGRDHNYRGTASRGRLGRSGEERGTEIQQISTTEMSSESLPNSPGSKVGSNLDLKSTSIQPLDEEDRQTILRISNVIKQQLDQGWKIEDSGPISRGWGD